MKRPRSWQPILDRTNTATGFYVANSAREGHAFGCAQWHERDDDEQQFRQFEPA
jgi:hypothetical protein